MVNVSQHDFQELVGYDGAAVCKPKQGVICEDCLDAHGTSMDDTFMT